MNFPTRRLPVLRGRLRLPGLNTGGHKAVGKASAGWHPLFQEAPLQGRGSLKEVGMRTGLSTEDALGYLLHVHLRGQHCEPPGGGRLCALLVKGHKKPQEVRKKA